MERCRDEVRLAPTLLLRRRSQDAQRSAEPKRLAVVGSERAGAARPWKGPRAPSLTWKFADTGHGRRSGLQRGTGQLTLPASELPGSRSRLTTSLDEDKVTSRVYPSLCTGTG